MKKNENVSLFVRKSSSKTRLLLLRRLCQRFRLSLQKERSRSLSSLSFLSWEWKSLTRNKISQRLDNFVKISLICVKVRRFRLFNSSMISAISSVEKYDFVNTVTIIANRLNVSMSVFFRLSVKSKKRNFAFDLVRFSISESSDAVFFSTFSTLFDVESVSFVRFFVSFSNDYRDSLSVSRSRFLSKISQEKSHVSSYFSINLKKENVKYFSNFWKFQTRQRKLLKSLQYWHESNENSVFVRLTVSHRDWKLLCVFCVKHDSICKRNYRKICERCEIAYASCRSICV